MKVVVAIDSLKGSLSSIEAGEAIRKGVLRVVPNAEVIVKPVADGGEGTTQAFVEGFNGRLITIPVKGPLANVTEASYGVVEESKTAIIEMAEASGITLIKSNEKNPLDATTYGVGEMILHAIDKGCRDFIVGIGGSATNDCGIGMLMALGYEFFDIHNQNVSLGAKGIKHVHTISDSKVNPKLKECRFKVACDVNNPLYGPTGATYIFGPQKGVTEDLKEELDQAIQKFSRVSSAFTNNDFSKVEGAGAAGGLGYAFISYLNAELVPGITLVLEAIKLEESIQGADYVITGEGQLDKQTAMGKVPCGIAKLAKKYSIPVIAFAGGLSEEAYLCNEVGIDAYFSILPRVMGLEQAMEKEQATKNLTNTTEQVFRVIVNSK